MKLPAFFLIAPTPLLDKIPNSYATLWHNQDRLNSKLDMRETILYLAEFLFKTELPRNEKYINVFQDLIPNSRECSDARVLPQY